MTDSFLKSVTIEKPYGARSYKGLVTEVTDFSLSPLKGFLTFTTSTTSCSVMVERRRERSDFLYICSKAKNPSLRHQIENYPSISRPYTVTDFKNESVTSVTGGKLTFKIKTL